MINREDLNREGGRVATSRDIIEKLKDSETELIFGPYYRNKDALVLHFGLLYKDVTYRVSYDINTSSLRSISKYKGGIEFSVIYKKPLTRRLASLE